MDTTIHIHSVWELANIISHVFATPANPRYENMMVALDQSCCIMTPGQKDLLLAASDNKLRRLLGLSLHGQPGKVKAQKMGLEADWAPDPSVSLCHSFRDHFAKQFQKICNIDNDIPEKQQQILIETIAVMETNIANFGLFLASGPDSASKNLRTQFKPVEAGAAVTDAMQFLNHFNCNAITPLKTFACAQLKIKETELTERVRLMKDSWLQTRNVQSDFIYPINPQAWAQAASHRRAADKSLRMGTNSAPELTPA